LKEAERVRHGRTTLPDTPRYIIMGQLEVLYELLVSAGLIESVEILSLQVLDERLLQARHIVDNSYDGWNSSKAGSSRCSVATLTGDYLILTGRYLSHQDWLDDTYGLD
jgi:hypothetical protein